MTAADLLRAVADLLDETAVDQAALTVTFYSAPEPHLTLTGPLSVAEILAAQIGAKLRDRMTDIPGNHWSAFEGRLDGVHVEIRGDHQ